MLHCCIGVHARVYLHLLCGCGVHYTGVLGTSAYAGVYVMQEFFDISIHSCEKTPTRLQGVHMRWCVRSLFISVGGRHSELVYSEHFLLACRRIFGRRRDGRVVCVFSIFGHGRECMWVYDEDCFYDHSWRNNVVIAFGTLSSFLTCFT